VIGRRLFILTIAGLSACAPAFADTITIGVPVDDVDIIRIRGATITFRHDGTIYTRPLSIVESLAFDDLPALSLANDEIARSDHEAAVPHLVQALADATTEAQTIWIHAQLLLIHDVAGRSAEAMRHFAEIIVLDDDASWEPSAPNRSGQAATQTTIDAAREALGRAINETRRIRMKNLLRSYLDELDTLPVATVEANPMPEHSLGDPVELPQRDAIGAALDAGDAQRALSIIQEQAGRPGADLARLFHDAAIALIALDRPADAVLCCLRCAAHFPDDPHAPRACLLAASIYAEQFGNTAAALRIARHAATLAEAQGDDATLARVTDAIDAYESVEESTP
jgi:tetratricopeptide (TPR) repeat protein